MKVEVVNGSIVGFIDIKAPAEDVMEALIHSDRWWGQKGMYQTTGSHMDLRPGGEWISEGTMEPDDEPFYVKGTVLAYEPPTLLSYTWNPSFQPNLPETTVTYRLEPVDGGTRVHLTHGSFAHHDESSASHYQGWTIVMGWLQKYCEVSVA